MAVCLGCGAPLLKRHQKVYCSVACQMQIVQARLLEQWLATGEGVPQSKRRHYIRAYLFEQ